MGTTPLRVRQVAFSDKVASATAGRTYLSLYIVVKSNFKDGGGVFFNKKIKIYNILGQIYGCKKPNRWGAVVTK